MKTALVLAGGGAKGAYEVGAWQALEEFNITFDVLAGTSIGAINGFLMATKDVAFAKTLWQSLGQVFSSTVSERVSMIPDQAIGMIDQVFRMPETALQFVNVNGIVDSSFVEEQIKNILGDKRIDKDLYVGAVEAKEQPEVRYFNLKDKEADFVAKAIISSASIPIISSAVEIEGKHYFDGGLIQNVPITPLLNEDCDLIITSLLKDKDLDHLKVYTNKPILPLMPSRELGNFKTGTMNFSREAIEMKMELGYEDTYKTLQALKQLF